MLQSEDGTVTGSIDVSKLDQIEPKTPEAKAQIDALKAEHEAGQKQAAADAERLAEQARAQNPVLRERSVGDQTGDDDDEKREAQFQQKQDAEQQQRAADEKAGQDQSAEVKKLQAEAEAAGVTVDKRWGADRLRQEIDTAKSASARKQR